MINILIDGVEYVGFQSINMNRSITRFVNYAEINVSTDNIETFPIKIGSKIQIKINNKITLTGYVERMTLNYSVSGNSVSHSITVEAFDKTIDIEQSTLDNTIILSAPTTIQSIIEKVLTYLELRNDVKIINKAGSIESFSSDYIVSSDIGEKAIDFINKYANMREILVVTDGDGNINLLRTPSGSATVSIINKKGVQNGNVNNIKNATMVFDNTNRFNTYKVYSQAQTMDFFKYEGAGNAVSISGITKDEYIRKSRKMVIMAESSADNDKCVKRAIWEKNTRIAPSRSYTVDVYSFFSKGGTEAFNAASNVVWEPGLLVNVDDDFANIASELLVQTVVYSWSIDGGSVCNLGLINKHAISDQLKINKATEEANLEGKSVGSFFK